MNKGPLELFAGLYIYESLFVEVTDDSNTPDLDEELMQEEEDFFFLAMLEMEASACKE